MLLTWHHPSKRLRDRSDERLMGVNPNDELAALT